MAVDVFAQPVVAGECMGHVEFVGFGYSYFRHKRMVKFQKSKNKTQIKDKRQQVKVKRLKTNKIQKTPFNKLRVL